jgi:hypothetical protein
VNIARELVPTSTIEDFADKHGLTMEVRERGGDWQGTDGQFYARFRHADVLESPFLIGEFGNGHTEAEAIRAYAKAISEKVLCVDSWTPKRREIVCPRFVETPARRARRRKP